MEDKNKVLLEKIGGILAESSTSVIPMLIPQPVEVSMGSIDEWKPEAYPEPMVLVTSGFTDGPSGSVYLLFKANLASKIIDLMLGGEGAEDRSLNDEAKGALKEIVNQIFGVTATSMREAFESAVGFSQAEVHSLEAGIDLNLLLGDETQNRIELSISVGDSEPDSYSCCLPLETLESLLSSLEAKPKPVAAASAAEPAAAVAPAPVAPAAPIEAGEALAPAAQVPGNVDLIMDIELPIVIKLGNAEMTLQEILRLGPGAIIELNKTVDEPVELLVNNKLIARGEVVVVEGNFAFRVTDISSRTDRIQSLG